MKFVLQKQKQFTSTGLDPYWNKSYELNTVVILGGWDERISMSLRPDWDTQWVPGFHGLQRKPCLKNQGNMVRSHTPLGSLSLLKVNFFFRLLIIEKETITFQGNVGGAAYLLFQNILHAILSVNKDVFIFVQIVTSLRNNGKHLRTRFSSNVHA